MRKIGMEGTVFHYQSIDIEQKCIRLFAKLAVGSLTLSRKNEFDEASINKFRKWLNSS